MLYRCISPRGGEGDLLDDRRLRLQGELVLSQQLERLCVDCDVRAASFSSPAVLDAFRSLTFTPIFRVLALYSIHLLAIDGYVSSLDRNRFSAIIHHEVAKHGFAYPYVTPRELCVFGVQLGVLFVSANWVFERCFRRFYSGLRLDSCPADAPTGLESMQLYLVQLLWNVLSARSCLAFDEEVRVAWWCEE